MGLQLRTALGWLCLMVVAHALALPTPDTMVVARSDDDHTEPTSSVSDVMTEGPSPAVKLTEMTVTSNIALRYAHTAVVTHVRNPAKKAQEATFRVLLPETAFISGFIMTLNGKSYKAYVKEKEEAKQIYDQAVSQGVGAAHITTKARDSNHFTVSVNVEPNTAAIFNLTYEELLVRRNGVYNHAINLHPGDLVPNLTVTVNIHETEKITVLRVPEIRTGNEVDATPEDPQNSLAVIERGHDDRVASVTFKPDLEEQRRLIALYMDKTKESRSSGRTYHFYSVPEEKAPESDGTLGQFVVQYDVDRPKNGEVLVNDGYFVHFFAPSELPPLNKHVVFVLDTSGSMMDRKIVQLREAMQTILSDLNPGDYFSIVEFASSVIVHELKEADLEPKQPSYNYGFDWEAKAAPKLVPPAPATPENIARAKVIISRLDAAGGTNIGDALDAAVLIIKKGIYTETEVNGTTQATPLALHIAADEKPEQPTTHAQDTEVDEQATRLEPIIIFLTDGDPTVGQTDPTKIINHLTEKNFGKNKATIFSLAFGEDADRKFLRKISLRNDGFMRHIYEASDAALQLRDFYRQVSSPLLADVRFTYPPDQVQADSLTKHNFRTFYSGSETVVAGRVREGVTSLTPRLEGYQAADDAGKNKRKRYEVVSKSLVEQKRQTYYPLERLWAALSVRQLLDRADAALPADKDMSPEKKALAISLKYELVTPLTSLVVVKPNATNAVNAESVDKDNNTPYALPGAASVPLSAHYSSAILGLPGAQAAPYPVFEDSALPEAIQSEDYFDGDFSSGQETRQMIRPHLFSYRRGGPYRYAAAVPARLSSHAVANSYSIGHFTTPLYFSSAFPPSTSVPGAPSPLAPFNMQGYLWAEPIFSAADKALVFEHNNKTEKLVLSENGTEPMDKDFDAACPTAVSGTSGLCVYVTRCGAARTISLDVYKTSFCAVDGSYAGVCCPQFFVTNARVKGSSNIVSTSTEASQGDKSSVKA
ncbi:inter-alpha-trypsin inhibitor heavy chain H4-like isoform X4 [Plodia interpunctella]|uniref:inter-alpha-trypsin inhibitor heavy chain H4-like isoform X4 n=1 Tax=Plodia interpunctella TaxID=58824 RepID=UPI002367DC10|nr:inter-alpha-trypsin inhibitor heavy chain H4-like isoform X4 [Plodia interpunctella]